MTRNEVIADARRWIGTPYHEQASLRGTGSDCLGLIGGIARDRGTREGIEWMADPEFKGYGPQPQVKLLLAGTDKYLDRIRIDEATIADILMMRFEEDPQHFALISRIEPTYIIHASSTRGKVVEHRADVAWQERVVRAYRYRGIE